MLANFLGVRFPVHAGTLRWTYFSLQLHSYYLSSTKVFHFLSYYYGYSSKNIYNGEGMKDKSKIGGTGGYLGHFGLKRNFILGELIFLAAESLIIILPILAIFQSFWSPGPSGHCH